MLEIKVLPCLEIIFMLINNVLYWLEQKQSDVIIVLYNSILNLHNLFLRLYNIDQEQLVSHHESWSHTYCDFFPSLNVMGLWFGAGWSGLRCLEHWLQMTPFWFVLGSCAAKVYLTTHSFLLDCLPPSHHPSRISDGSLIVKYYEKGLKTSMRKYFVSLEHQHQIISGFVTNLQSDMHMLRCKNLPLMNKFFLLRADFFLEGEQCRGIPTGSHKICHPLINGSKPIKCIHFLIKFLHTNILSKSFLVFSLHA